MTLNVETRGFCAIVVIELGFGLRGRRQIQGGDFTHVRKGDIVFFIYFLFFMLLDPKMSTRVKVVIDELKWENKLLKREIKDM